jgi:hypothetical protein
MNRLINNSRNEIVNLQVYDACLQKFDVCTLRHTAHIEAIVPIPAILWSASQLWWSLQPPKAPCCLKLLIPASNASGRWGITVELSPECPLNRNNWFMLHKLQHTKRFLLRSRHYRFVTSQTEREEESGIAHAHKTWAPAVSFRGKLTSACVLKAVMADWNRFNHCDTPCIFNVQSCTTWFTGFLGYKFWPISPPSSDLYTVKNLVKKTIQNPIYLYL